MAGCRVKTVRILVAVLGLRRNVGLLLSRMLEEWNPPRSPRSPRSPMSARMIREDVNDAFDDTDDDPVAAGGLQFSRLDLPSRAELEQMASGAHWDDSAEGSGQPWAEESKPTVLLEPPPSPHSFRRSRTPSLSPTRIADAHANTFPVPSPPPSPPAKDNVISLVVEEPASDSEVATVGQNLQAVDLAGNKGYEGRPNGTARASSYSTTGHSQPAADSKPVWLADADVDAGQPHDYPAVHIDVKHRTVQSISSQPGEPADTLSPTQSTHTAQHSVDSTSSQHTQPEPSSSTSASFPQSPTSPTAFKHAQSKSRGPSALEKVLSKTRPMHLPPKNKEEDTKHLKDWEEMMRQSRVADDKRKQQMLERRRAREMQVEASIPIWEREVLPDWTVAKRDDRLKRLWWNGIPSKLRGTLWQQAIGNDFAVPKGQC